MHCIFALLGEIVLQRSSAMGKDHHIEIKGQGKVVQQLAMHAVRIPSGTLDQELSPIYNRWYCAADKRDSEEISNFCCYDYTNDAISKILWSTPGQHLIADFDISWSVWDRSNPTKNVECVCFKMTIWLNLCFLKLLKIQIFRLITCGCLGSGCGMWVVPWNIFGRCT